jgi:pyruvate carboxylase
MMLTRLSLFPADELAMTTVAIYSYEDRLGAHRHKVRTNKR